MTHSFARSLAKSQSYAYAPWWEQVYRNAFGNVAATACMRSDGWAQRGGIDRVVTLESGKTYAIDEKVREKTWPDFLLEYWSDFGRHTLGWVAKDQACDFIAYAFVPAQRCYLLPFAQLRRAWRVNGRAWVDTYHTVEAFNEERDRAWTTVSVAVPIEVVMKAITDAMCVTWE